MKILISACLFLSATAASCQLHWEKSTDWKIYRYQGHQLFKISIDSLKLYDSSPLSPDSMAVFVDSFKSLRPRGPVAWMGGYISTCKLDGDIRKVEISNYGGFIYDEKSRTYYELPLELRGRWLDYLQETYLDLVKKKQPSEDNKNSGLQN